MRYIIWSSAMLGFVLTLSLTALAQNQAAVEHGMKVFADSKCSLCHSVAGKGNAKGVLDNVGAELSADELRQWITNPTEMSAKAKATRKPPMKSFASMPKADLDALVAYLQTLKTK